MSPAGPSGSTPGGVTTPLLAISAALLLSVLGAAGCGGDMDNRPAKWSFISATITETACATVGCHSEVAQQASVDLHDPTVGYNSLVLRHFVIQGDPLASPVMALMHGQGSVRMPPDLPLPEVDIQLIGRWILDGANND